MPKGVYQRASLSDRFWAKVDTSGPVPAHRPELGPCHIWIGNRTVDGRGKIKIDGVSHGAHRVAFFLGHGRWPDPCALHECDGGAIGCVRLDHLFEGTFADNTADMFAKGRNKPGGRRGAAHPRAKLTDDLVLAIRAALAAGESQRSVADRLRMGKSSIGAIATGKHWRHLHAVNSAHQTNNEGPNARR